MQPPYYIRISMPPSSLRRGHHISRLPYLFTSRWEARKVVRGLPGGLLAYRPPPQLECCLAVSCSIAASLLPNDARPPLSFFMNSQLVAAKKAPAAAVTAVHVAVATAVAAAGAALQLIGVARAVRIMVRERFLPSLHSSLPSFLPADRPIRQSRDSLIRRRTATAAFFRPPTTFFRDICVPYYRSDRPLIRPFARVAKPDRQSMWWKTQIQSSRGNRPCCDSAGRTTKFHICLRLS